MADEQASLTAGDWIGFVMAAGLVVGLLAFPLFAGPFEAMFADFGAGAHLPVLTQLALTPWFAPLLAVLPAGALGVALMPRFSRLGRRLAIVAAFIAGSVLLAGCVVALYLPIVALSGAIQG